MMLIKSLLLAGFVLASALADCDKPSIATMQVQSNFDFSLTRNEFRVHYSGLGDGFTSISEPKIKILKKGDSEVIHEFTVKNKEKKDIFQFALENAKDDEYEVQVCADDQCSDRNPALTEIIPFNKMKITCNRVLLKDGQLEASPSTWEVDFEGPEDQDWISVGAFTGIEAKVNTALEKAQKTGNYLTDYSKLKMSENPQYKHDGRVFYAGVKFDIARYKKLFDKMPSKNGKEGHEYADEFCERKYLLSAHAHIVDQNTKEVKHRFKTTLFLSEGGKQMYVLSPEAEKVHVEMTHEGVNIPAGTYDLWITFCATEKDAIESTFCAKPLIKKGFQVIHTE